MDFDNIITEEKIDLETFGKLSSYRNMIYNFFSRVFAKRPDLKFLESLTHEEIESVIGGLCEDDQAAKDLGLSVKEILSSNNNLENTEREFDELFIIPTPGRFIPPYISYYLGGGNQKTGLGGGDKSGNEGDLALVDKLEITYKTLNFELKDQGSVSMKRPDHISYILGFMAALISLEDRYLTGQTKEPMAFKEVVVNEFMFFNEFVGNWAGLFADEIIQRSGSAFYSSAAKLMQGFIACEKRDYNSIVTKI